jgi:hypothetical protein
MRIWILITWNIWRSRRKPSIAEATRGSDLRIRRFGDLVIWS